LIPQGFQWIY